MVEVTLIQCLIAISAAIIGGYGILWILNIVHKEYPHEEIAALTKRIEELEQYTHYHEEMTGWVSNQNFRRAGSHFGWGASKAIPVSEGKKVSHVWNKGANSESN